VAIGFSRTLLHGSCVRFFIKYRQQIILNNASKHSWSEPDVKAQSQVAENVFWSRNTQSLLLEVCGVGDEWNLTDSGNL
jgi:hypothetical protein